MIARGLSRRALALAGVALVGAVIALSGDSLFDRSDDNQQANVPEQVPVPGAGWYTALAAPYPAGSRRERTACGQRLGPRTLGVAHPVLPCGVKIFISYREKVVLTQVVDRGPNVPGRQFDVTRPLAARIGLRGTQRVRWRYAR
jgi:rare lipoprotein A (peptidoglycan hydrolase)